MANTTIQAAQQMSAANKGQTSQALVLQGYANSVIQQPTVDLSGFENLLKYQTDINTGLGTAKDHANNYLNNIQPAIITNITDIYNYYALHSAIATTAGPNTTEEQWLTNLGLMQEQPNNSHQMLRRSFPTLRSFTTTLRPMRRTSMCSLLT